MYDLIIIGGGPAGVGAAVYSARKKLKTAIIAEEFGGQSKVSLDIQNWIGTPHISGTDLAKNLEEHVRAYAADTLDIREGEKVTMVEKNENGFTVTAGEIKCKTKTILIASGSRRRKLQVKGAAKFDGKGIVYCASCDGPLFTGLEVAVVGSGNSGFETAAQLLEYTPKVTLFNRGNSFKADEVIVNKVLNNPKMVLINSAEIIEVKGDKMVSSIVYKTTGDETLKEIPALGVFVEIGQVPNTEYIADVVDVNDYKHIKINPLTQRTSVAGIWAAGDCTDVLYHQNNIAVGDGVRAVEDIFLAVKTT